MNDRNTAKIIADNRYRFTFTDYDKYEIARLQQEIPGLPFESAQLFHEYRGKARRYLFDLELRFCSALEDRVARAKAERIVPLHSIGNGYSPRPNNVPAAYGRTRRRRWRRRRADRCERLA